MNSKNCIIFFINIYCCFITCAHCMEYQCFKGHLHLDGRYDTRGPLSKYESMFNQSLDNLPLTFTITEGNATDSKGFVTTLPGINVSITEVQENVTLRLLAIPFNTSECPAQLTKEEDVRLYVHSHKVSTADANNVVIDYNCIFTGCYYFMMKSEQNNKTWQSAPQYFQRNYNFADQKITVIGKPQYTEYSRMMDVTFKLPLYCLEIGLRMYDSCKKDDNIQSHPTITYTISVENATAPVEINPPPGRPASSTSSSTSPYIEGHISERANDSEATIISIKWTNLEHGCNYTLKFRPQLNKCDYKHDQVVIMLWGVPGTDELSDTSAYPEPRNDEPISCNLDVLKIVCYTMSTSAICTILVYWIFKCQKLCKKPKHLGHEKWTESTVLCNNQGSDQILLIYERGSPEFNEEMNRLRQDLEQKCDCKVHELYSQEDFDMIAKLTVHRWLRDHMNSGSKFIWVDTPQFRDRFKDGQQQNTSNDFRSKAIPYAVDLTKKLTPNAPSQYICHFVVRVKGFQVEDGRNDDPLLLVSPGERYFIPEDLDCLCKHLRKFIRSFRMRKHSYS